MFERGERLVKYRLNNVEQPTLIPAELLEIYQPIVGYEAICVWINLYHNLVRGQEVPEPELLQRMNMTQKSFHHAIKELKRCKLLEQVDKAVTVVHYPLSVEAILAVAESATFPPEQKRRLVTLAESFLMRRGQTSYQEVAATVQSPADHTLSEQAADEFATRFIKECNFVPNRQLRERFDWWFAHIRDTRLLEELLERTKRKVQLEGAKGTCPSVYADKIVRQWVLQGIKNYEDLLRVDQEFHARWEYYRAVERELGRSYNSLTPAEKEIVDRWMDKAGTVEEMRAVIQQAILSGEYQGKGAPTVAFIDQWFSGKGKRKADAGKPAYTHRHSITDLQKVIKRKTMIGMGDDGSEG